jgi:hypothetical protein
MSTQTTPRGFRALGLALIAGLAVCAPFPAHSGGHFGGFGHGGFGHGGFGHGGFGFHNGFGFRGGCCFRGGFGWWGWPGYGLFLATLPLYYSTYWWNGVPYYYANDNYYVWNSGLGGYQTVAPPPQVSNQAAAPRGDKDLFAYPKTGQSAEQQNRDRQECRTWAASQTGGATDGEGSLRAQAACLEGRGYSVK